MAIAIATKARAAWRASIRRRIIRITWFSSRGLFAALVVWLVVNAVVPIVMIISLGDLVAAVPAAAREGFSSPAGHHLRELLIVFSALFAAALVLAPVQTGLAAIVRVRLTYEMQDDLLRSVSAPIGIEHLEDPDVLDRIALARGSLMSFYAADAPIALAQAFSLRLNGALACLWIGWSFWWIAVLLVVLWSINRYRMLAVSRAQVRAYAGNAGILRRAEYFFEVATRPETAKENRVFGLRVWIIDELRRHWRDGMAASWIQHRRYYLEVLRFAIPVLVLYLGACAYVAHEAFIGVVSIGTVSTFLVMLTRAQFVGGLNNMDGEVEWMGSALPEVEAIDRAVRKHAAASSGPDGAGGPGGSSSSVSSSGRPLDSIRFEQTTFRYPGASSDVLSGLDLEIPAGQSTAIVGVNGAGKTTLVKLLARLHEPTGGRLVVDGVPLTDYDARDWQQRVSVVFQDFNHYPASAYDNVMFGASRFADDADGVRSAARRAGADAVIDALSDGWQTMLSRDFTDGTDLSGGQWQRVALARALFATTHGATVLVLDEPTAWLDVRGEAAFYEQFLDLTRGLTTVVISHRFSTVRLADHICVLEDGRLVERGSHDELVALDGRYAEMFRLQASRFVDSVEGAVES